MIRARLAEGSEPYAPSAAQRLPVAGDVRLRIEVLFSYQDWSGHLTDPRLT